MQCFCFGKSIGDSGTSKVTNQETNKDAKPKKVKKYKRILDSVHGTISIEERYFQLIDTPHFQRLRRIEQTSTRSIFPSARHDRFVHSLGVFYIGQEIVNHLKSDIKNLGIFPVDDNKKRNSTFRMYLVACLLHDVGHSPFSHSFEKYIGKKDELCNKLRELINIDSFSQDTATLPKDTKWHEYASAILCCQKPLNRLIQRVIGKECDFEFIARMITGIEYSNDEGEYSLRNCFVKLLHGEIDADRIDYACRDTWAAGYSKHSIDAKSLITCMHIRRRTENANSYCICFDKRALTEIESVFGVKEFQNLHVFNHHTVIYEQHLLDRAVLTTALSKAKDEDPGFSLSEVDAEFKAMNKILNIDTLTDNDENIKYICDDDLICLMKKYNNDYYEEWSSRQYKMISVWKSMEEFSCKYKIKHVLLNKDINFEERISKKLEEILQPYEYNDEKSLRERFYIGHVEIRENSDLSKIHVLLDDHIVKYTDIHHAHSNNDPNVGLFYYVYVEVPEGHKKKQSINDFRREVVVGLRDTIDEIYGSNNCLIQKLKRCIRYTHTQLWQR